MIDRIFGAYYLVMKKVILLTKDELSQLDREQRAGFFVINVTILALLMFIF